VLNIFESSTKFLLYLEGTFYSFQVKAASKYVDVPVSIKNSLIFLLIFKSILCKTNFLFTSPFYRNQGWTSQMAMWPLSVTLRTFWEIRSMRRCI